MHITAYLHSPPATGSDTTIRRIISHLTHTGHSVTLAEDGGKPEGSAVIATHAILSKEFLRSCELPYVLVFGGTDLNEFVLEPEYRAAMTATMNRAAALVALNQDFVERCLAIWPAVAPKLVCIPQAVETQPSQFSLRRALNYAPTDKLFLLPAGLRQVKDPLFLSACMNHWQAEDPSVRLLIAGATYEPEFHEIVLRRCARHRGIEYIGELPREDLHAAMLEVVAVVNTSLSECCPNSLLEAMHLGVPVIGRNIPGNVCLIEDGVTGLTFDDPDEFRKQAERLLTVDNLAADLTRHGRELVDRVHSPEQERDGYARIFQLISQVQGAEAA